MIFVCSSTVAAILCQFPITSNPKTVGGMCHAILDVIGLRSHHSTDLKYLSWSGLQQKPLGKHQSEIVIHKPGKPHTLSQHASAKLDMLSQNAKCRQAIPACIAKVTVYKGLQEPRTVDKWWTSRDSEIAIWIGGWQSNDNNTLGS